MHSTVQLSTPVKADVCSSGAVDPQLVPANFWIMFMQVFTLEATFLEVVSVQSRMTLRYVDFGHTAQFHYKT